MIMVYRLVKLRNSIYIFKKQGLDVRVSHSVPETMGFTYFH